MVCFFVVANGKASEEGGDTVLSTFSVRGTARLVWFYWYAIERIVLVLHLRCKYAGIVNLLRLPVLLMQRCTLCITCMWRLNM